MKSPARFLLCPPAVLGFLMAGCATGSLAPLVPAENAPYVGKGSGLILGLVLVNGAPANRNTVYLCPDTKHFAEWAARAGPWLWEPGKLPPLGPEECIYVHRTRTDVAGLFLFSGLPPGSYIVLMANRGTKKVVRLDEGQFVQVKLENSIFEGDPDHSDNSPYGIY